jgi:hypothetical protein
MVGTSRGSAAGGTGGARAWADAQVEAARDDPAARLALLVRTYHGPTGAAPRHLPFRRAAVSFMRWQVQRGVLNPPDGSSPGSGWWRAVNEGLLRDGCEAVALARSGAGAGTEPSSGPGHGPGPGPASGNGSGGGSAAQAGEVPSSPAVALWLAFIDDPTARNWYRAHNASIVRAYLEHLPLAETESAAERFFMNVALARVLFTHAVVAAPHLALGRLGRLGRVLGDPRLGAAGVFLSLRRVLPDHYPLVLDVEAYVADERNVGRLLDHAFIVPRLQALYEWSAGELGEPDLLDLVVDGNPAYAWPSGDRHVWRRSPVPLPARALALATRPRH